MNVKPEGADKEVRQRGRVIASALIVLMVSLACSAATRLTSRVSQVSDSDGLLGRIAYTGIDGNIYTIDRDGNQQTAITQDADRASDPGPMANAYLYPTWAPNGRQLAFVGFSSESITGPQADLYTVSSDGTNRKVAFSSQHDFPFYLFWSPNSEQITFLSSAADGISLALSMAPAGGGERHVIGTGQPFYWDWSPDNQAVIAHVGGATSDNPEARLTLYEMSGTRQGKVLNLSPGSFQAPAWSPTGDELILIVENEAGIGEMVLVGRDGQVKRVLTQLEGPAAFAWSPDGGNLAYTIHVDDDNPGFVRRLIILDPDRPDSEIEAASGIVLAFFWSPDNRKIVYLAFEGEEPGETSLIQTPDDPGIRLAVRLYDLRSGETRLVTTFSPTESFQSVLPFFDQYQRSGTIWSPDSKELVLSGLDDRGNPGIYVVSVDGGDDRKIADGDLAFWAWK